MQTRPKSILLESHDSMMMLIKCIRGISCNSHCDVVRAYFIHTLFQGGWRKINTFFGNEIGLKNVILFGCKWPCIPSSLYFDLIVRLIELTVIILILSVLI